MCQKGAEHDYISVSLILLCLRFVEQELLTIKIEFKLNYIHLQCQTACPHYRCATHLEK